MNNNQKNRRKLRTRKNLKTKFRQRVTVCRSNKYISGQIIDDVKNETIVGVSEKELKMKATKTEKSKALGLLLAEKAKKKKIKKVVFDRGQYAYHGRVRSFAEGLREGGLDF